jgi:hypothetical protein
MMELIVVTTPGPVVTVGAAPPRVSVPPAIVYPVVLNVRLWTLIAPLTVTVPAAPAKTASFDGEAPLFQT